MLRRRPRLTVAVAGWLLALSAFAAACSGNGDDPPATTTSAPLPETTAPPTTAQPGEQMSEFSIGPGECFDQRIVADDDGEVPADFRVDCSSAHQNEVFVSVEYPAPAGDGYPDEVAWNQFLAEQCYALVEVYVGTPYELSELEVSHRKPTPESWAAEPDRQVTCWLHTRDGAKLAQSVMGSNR